MPGCMVQLSFKLNVSVEDYERAVTHAAQAIAAVDGLRWKIWIVNQTEREAGGVYQFENEEAADAYLSGPIITQLRGAPFQRDLVARKFGIIESLTAITRGPLPASSSVIG